MNELHARSESKCELCSATEDLDVYKVEPERADNEVLACATCREQLDSGEYDEKHWFGLQDAIWSQFPAVQVLAVRTLRELASHGWAQDLLDQVYLDEETQAWADEGMEVDSGEFAETFDSNGAQLFNGDSVTLIKDLDVKGAGFTAKRGTLVKNIRLTQNPKHIEGKVNKVGIVLVTDYLKKA